MSKTEETTDDHITNDLDEMYDQFADHELFDIAYNMVDYCRTEVPVLLNKRDSLWEILNLFKEHIEVPYTLEVKDDIQSDDDLADDSLLCEK